LSLRSATFPPGRSSPAGLRPRLHAVSTRRQRDEGRIVYRPTAANQARKQTPGPAGYKPSSVPAAGGPPASGRRPFIWTRRCRRALPMARDAAYPRPSAPATPWSLLGLAPGGVCRAAPLTRNAVRSYRTLSPLPFDDLRAVCFLWHFPCPDAPDEPNARDGGRYPPPRLSGARTFLSSPEGGERPSAGRPCV